MSPLEADVVIVNFMTADPSAELAKSVAGYKGIRKVFIVDNSGTADTVRDLVDAEPTIEVIASASNVGFGQACNAGAGAAEAPLLLLLNSDLHIDERSVQALVNALADRSVGIVAPRLVGPNGMPEVAATGVYPTICTLLTRRNRRPSEDPPDWVSGAAMGLRREDFERLGGFDPSYHMYFEDIELCQRFHRSGRRIVVVSDAVAIHEGGGSRHNDFSRQRQYAKSQRRYLRSVDTPWLLIALAGAGTWGGFAMRRLRSKASGAVGRAQRWALSKRYSRALKQRPGPR